MSNNAFLLYTKPKPTLDCNIPNVRSQQKLITIHLNHHHNSHTDKEWFRCQAEADFEVAPELGPGSLEKLKPHLNLT